MVKQRSRVGLLTGSTNAGMCLFWNTFIVLLSLLLSAQLIHLSFSSYSKVSYKGLALTVICFLCHCTGLLGGSLTENRRMLVVVRNADSAVMLICQYHDNSFVNNSTGKCLLSSEHKGCAMGANLYFHVYLYIDTLIFVHFCPTPTLMLFFARY